jgi:type II secretory pathway component PulL
MTWFRRHRCPVSTEKVHVPDPKAWNAGFDACLTIMNTFGKKAARLADQYPEAATIWTYPFLSLEQRTEHNRKAGLARAEAVLKKRAEDAEFKAKVLAALEDSCPRSS